LSAALNPPSLAETINAKGFSHAASFRIVTVEPGRAEVALARRDDLVQFFGHFHGGVITALADQAAGIAVTGSIGGRHRRSLQQGRGFRNPLRVRYRHHARPRSACRVPMTASGSHP
jgi:acyl-coenzyme A thioesterase PaaI-like protein